MDFSIFEPLLALREELLKKSAGIGSAPDKASIELVKRIVQQRDRTKILVAESNPASDIEEILRAAAAPLPALPEEDTRLKLTPEARRSDNTTETFGKATKTAKAAKAGKVTKAKKAKRARKAPTAKKATKARKSET